MGWYSEASEEWEYRNDYDVWEEEQVYQDQRLERNSEMTVYIAVVQNNPGLSNAFATKEEAVNWINSYLDNPIVMGDCWYVSHRSSEPECNGGIKAWLINREVS